MPNDCYCQVIERVRALCGQTTLLVISAEADAFFHKHHVPLSSRLPFVNVCPPPTSGRGRLCQLRRWSDFDGFGFELTADSKRPGLYVGDVELASPARAAGLQSGDRIIEVLYWDWFVCLYVCIIQPHQKHNVRKAAYCDC